MSTGDQKLSEVFPANYAAWVDNGGPEDQFRIQALCTNLINATDQDLLDFVILVMRQGTAILENIRAQQK